MDLLPADIVINLAISMAFDDLRNLCLANKEYYTVCRNDYIWNIKTQTDFPNFYADKWEDITWKDYYATIYRQMNTQITKVIDNIIKDKYPDNGGIDRYRNSWGIGFRINDDFPADTLQIHHELYSAVVNYKHHLDKFLEAQKPQIVIDYKRGQWRLDFIVTDNNDYFNREFSRFYVATITHIRGLLTKLWLSRITFTDILGQEIFTYNFH